MKKRINPLLYDPRRSSGPCSYWPDSKLISETELMSIGPPNASNIGALGQAFKFMESGLIVPFYSVAHPICPTCPKEIFCRPCRINLSNFELTPSQKEKIKNFQKTLSFDQTRLDPSEYSKIYKLYRNYMAHRHKKNYEFIENYYEFILSVAPNQFATIVRDKKSRDIIGCLFGNIHEKSARLTRHFYNTDYQKNSPGMCMILMTLLRLKQSRPDGMVYLGSWSPGSPKLDYKKQFKGFEVYDSVGKWVPYDYRNISTPIPEPCRKPLKERISFEKPSPSAGIRLG
jgi:arginyl-tRNA--protein-N-Asp/Glu arginylyltransferase